ncbi:tRNA pseudouridine(38-40) synthase TruA [Prochlorococcus marinus]|uniref:tRNA pseudouridine synthase A n=1 Tax=Prochlorococcus marinus str. GP2 TaxID=59925 RepID=A0A0A1Z7N9_PROMR|nr:tRNA pseudouridine(38-40) synthase TruA [Prochlorococcus marinus]KGF85597.1 tRNA pseudouridine synthase A [Prochlorococcus marinus str. GP2]
MKRVALLIQYDGSSYSGWQRQKNATTVQEILEQALFKITHHAVKTFAAGRTDAGVHASGQVVHFDTDCVIPGNCFEALLNSFLPSTIRILESVEVEIDSWHACYSAKYRHYRYVINNSKFPNLFINSWSWHRYQKLLDETLMSNASKSMEGEHDFFAFQKSGSTRSNSITNIKTIKINRVGDLIFIDIKATGFLYGMVRLIVGQLVLVGEKKISPKIFTDIWVNKKKNDVKESAPAKGLCFINAVYEENVFKKINKNDFFPIFLIYGFS